MTFLRIGLFGLSTLGSFQLIRRISKDKVDRFFLPSVTIAVQVTILFFAGILNLLPEISMLLYFIGLAALAASLWQNKGLKFVNDYINDGYIISILIMIIMGVAVKGKLFAHYDNFSHWAIVVRHMLEVNRFPNFDSSLIMFQQYPLGSASYIYYFARMINQSESIQMLAQIYMIVAAVLPLFSFVEKRSFRIDLVYIAIVNFVLIYNVKAGDLLVDTLLPAVGICALLFAKKHCRYDRCKLHFWLLSCYLVQIIQIKNSGIFFVLAVIAACIKHYWNKQNRVNNLCAALFPFLTLLIWQKHCKFVFSAAATSKHAMTVENYQLIFGSKTAEDIKKICTGVIRLSFTSKHVLVLLGIAVLVGCGIWFFARKDWKDYKICFIFTMVFYLCYQLGMFGMYLFSMPGGEATSLAGSERYLKTIIIAILLIYMAFAIKSFSNSNISESIKTLSAVVLFISIFIFSYVSQGKIEFAPATIDNSEERMWVEQNREKYAVPMHDSYCILIPKDDYGYAHFLLKYTFQSDDVSSEIIKSSDDLNSISAKYVFVYDQENDIIKTWINELYPEQTGNNVIIREDIVNE